MLSCLEILLLFKKMFLIMLINFFGDDFGIAFALIWGFPSIFFFSCCFGFRNTQTIAECRRCRLLGHALREGFSLRGRGGGLQWKPRQPRDPSHNGLMELSFLGAVLLPVCCSEKRKAPGSDGVVTEVLHSELGVSGQSQVLRTETFCCLLTECNQKQIFFFDSTC